MKNFERAPSKKQKLASKKTSRPGSPNIPQKQEEECAKQQKQEQQKSPLSSNMNFKVDAKPEKRVYPKTGCVKLKKTPIRESLINLMVIIYICQAKQTYLTTKRC